MMNYFEVRERIAVLKKFRRLYKEYLTFTNRSENPAAQLFVAKMRPLVPMTIDSLRRVGVGTIVTHGAKAAGSKKYRINLIKVIFRDSLSRHFNIPDDAPMEAIEAALVKYRLKSHQTLLQLFNPFFWLIHFFSYIAEMPFEVLRRCGYEVADLKASDGGKLIKLLIFLALFGLVAEASGLRRWIWQLTGIS